MPRVLPLSPRWTLLLLLAWLLSAPAPARQPPLVRAQGTRLLAPDGSELRLRGIGLGNWFVPEGYMFGFERAVSPRQIEQAVAELLGPARARRFWQTYRDRYVTTGDLALLGRVGFNCVRVPLHRALFEDEDGHPRAEGFRRLDRLVQDCRREGLWVVLDLHAAPGGQTGENIDDGWGYPWLMESEESQRETIALWVTLAGHYRDEPAVLGYELLNEPIPNHPGYAHLKPNLEPFYREATAAIRGVDPGHLVILDGAEWATDFSVFSQPFDPGVVYAFHRYWTDPGPAGLAPYLLFRDRWQVPVWMSESGENKNEWISRFRVSLEENGLGWCFWPYKKMLSESCVATIPTPSNWEELVRYADALDRTSEEKRKLRPSRQVADRALQGLLDNLPVERCQLNGAFLRALGLDRPD